MLAAKLDNVAPVLGPAIRKPRSAGVLATTVVAALLGGCVADTGDEAIIVMKNVFADADCKTNASETSVGIARGTLDLLIPTDYWFFAQLKSRITATSTEDKNTRTVFTSGANIDVTFPGSTLFSDAELAEMRDSALTRFKQPFGTSIAPNGGISDVPFVAIPQALVERIAAKADLSKVFRLEALVTITVLGELANGKVTSQPYSYGVTIGNGVAINVLGTCDSVQTGTAVRTGYSCNPAQDGVVDCCVTGASELLCPAVAPTTARPSTLQ